MSALAALVAQLRQQCVLTIAVGIVLAAMGTEASAQLVITPPRAAPDGPAISEGESSGTMSGNTILQRPTFSPITAGNRNLPPGQSRRGAPSEVRLRSRAVTIPRDLLVIIRGEDGRVLAASVLPAGEIARLTLARHAHSVSVHIL